MSDLNRAYRDQPALHSVDFRGEGFEWLDRTNHDESVLSFLRWDAARRRPVLAVCNFTPVPRNNIRCGVPLPGRWRELLNSDSKHYGGSGQGNLGGLEAAPFPAHNQFHSLHLTLPPLSCVLFEHQREVAAEKSP
jgi:1,4-alpha-glucan branching enzyme